MPIEIYGYVNITKRLLTGLVDPVHIKIFII